jgi:hypothetical protein
MAAIRLTTKRVEKPWGRTCGRASAASRQAVSPSERFGSRHPAIPSCS